jgi:hypothetical protein
VQSINRRRCRRAAKKGRDGELKAEMFAVNGRNWSGENEVRNGAGKKPTPNKAWGNEKKGNFFQRRKSVGEADKWRRSRRREFG